MNATMMDELEARVARARCRSRRPGDRQHRRRTAFQTGVDVVQIATDRGALREHSRQHARRHARASPRGTAGLEAGDRRGQRHVRRRWPALRRRRRHRDRRARRARSSTRTCRSARSSRTRGSRSPASCRWKPIMRMALVGRHERMTGRARVRSSASSSEIVDPPERLRERGAGARRDDREELARGDGGHQARAVGRARDTGSPTPAARARRSWRACGATPTKTKARSRSPRRAVTRADWRDAMRRTDDELRHPDRRAPRPGGLVDQQPTRPAQRDERADARRVRRRVDRARPRSRGAGDRAHRRTAARSRPASTSPRSRPTAWACSATASQRRATSTCTSPRGTSRCGSR